MAWIKKFIFELCIDYLVRRAYKTALDHGWWDRERSTGDCIALMHSELSEALEASRTDAKDDHLPQYSGLVVELADCIIRIFDFCARHNLPLAEALLDKMKCNEGREYRHGGKLL